jgi:hypothetical protein
MFVGGGEESAVFVGRGFRVCEVTRECLWVVASATT